MTVIEKDQKGSVQKELRLPERLTAPIQKGDQIGEIEYWQNGEMIGKSPVYAEETVERIGFWGVWFRILKNLSFY